MGILLANTHGATIRRNSNDGRHNEIAILLRSSSRSNTIETNSFQTTIGIDDFSHENDVITNSVSGVSVRESTANNVFHNDIRHIGLLEAAFTSIVGNTITGQNTIFGNGIRVTDSRYTTIRGNTISGQQNGIAVSRSSRTGIEWNMVRENTNGVLIQGGAPTTVLAGNNFIGNAQYGAKNLDSAVVNARYNYWGAANGPSSPEDVTTPLTDPRTGAPADGDGDAVSEHPDRAGVSNVYFQPWSETEVPVTTTPPPELGPPVTLPPPFNPPRPIVDG